VEYPFYFYAAVLESNNKPLSIKKIKFPGPLKPGQILVKLFYSGICGKQIEEIKGLGGDDPYLPHLLGHEATAIVLDKSAEVSKVNVGDTVVLHWMKGDGLQSEVPDYFCAETGIKINAGWVTTFNDHAVVSENRVTKISGKSDLMPTALFGCAATTGPGVVFNQMNISDETSVAVVGVGGVGLFVIQALALKKPKNIVAIDINDKALTLAKKMGATNIFNSSNTDFTKKINDIKGSGFDYVLTVTGDKEAIESSIELASVPGQVIIIGVPPKDSKIKVDPWKIMHLRNISGSLGGSINPSTDIPEYINLYEQGKLPIDTVVTNVFDFRNINQAIELFNSENHSGRIMIKFNHD